MGILHERENNSDSEQHLKLNGEKFTGDTLTAIRLMFAGIRLTSQDCWDKYGIHDRRLRNAYAGRPDIVKRDWVYTQDGKRTRFKEYWIEKFQPPTKKELQEWFSKYQSGDYEEPSFSKPTVISYPNENGKLIQGRFF